jgi:hypothetical protein
MAAAAGTTSDAVTMVGETNVGAIRVGVIVDGVTEAGVIAVGASHSGAGADRMRCPDYENCRVTTNSRVLLTTRKRSDR